MKIGEKINFIQNGKSYTGDFLEEQPHLFDDNETYYRISISDSLTRRELGITGKLPLIISCHQVYKDNQSKKAALKKYPYIEVELENVIKNENNAFDNNQMDMFRENSHLITTSRPKIR